MQQVEPVYQLWELNQNISVSLLIFYIVVVEFCCLIFLFATEPNPAKGKVVKQGLRYIYQPL